MTNDNRRESIAEELARAAETARAARALLEGHFPNDAVSRAYYAAFHAMRAAVISRGLDPKTHAGTLNLFNRELVRKGALPTFNRLLTGLQGARDNADYNAAVSFSEADAESLVADSDAFVRAVDALLRAEGWIAP